MKKKELYTVDAPWKVYSMGWSNKKDDAQNLRFACGSFMENIVNEVNIVQYSEDQDEFVQIATFKHPYPPTNIEWIPDPISTHNDLLATASEYLRIWKVEQYPKNISGNTSNNSNGKDKCSVNRLCLLNSTKTEYPSPLTSADWNEVRFFCQLLIVHPLTICI